jgi:ATP-dependent Clp protease ATP-binding subunit ClpA
MIRRLAPEARAAVRRAEAEARLDGSRSIEAEHLLLALASREGTGAHDVLVAAGLDHDGIRAALEREFRHSLLAVGVALLDPARLCTGGDSGRRLRLGQSAKLAWQRAIRLAAKRSDAQLDTSHLLVGVLRAQAGTVPRALADFGIDQAELAERAECTLTGRG